MKLGGSEKHVIALASGMKASGHRVKILALFRPGLLAPEVEKNGISFECLELPYRWGIKTFKAVSGWLSANPFEIVHTYLFGFDAFAAWPARLRKIPVVISSRREIPEWQQARHRLLACFGNRFVDKVVCCSKAVRNWVLEHERLEAAKAITIYNGVDLQRFEISPEAGRSLRRQMEIPEDGCLVGTVANFGKEKGYPYLLKAASRSLNQNPLLHFLFIGDGPLRREMEQEAALLSHGKRIQFAGFRSDIPELLNAMDIYVQASTREGMPNAVYEAMACARPVIATRVGGVPEVLEDNQDSLLVDAEDEHSLAKSIIRLSSDPLLRARLGTQARRKIEKSFSMDSMIRQYEELYTALLSPSLQGALL